MEAQACSGDVLLYRGKVSDCFAPAIILGWILMLALFGDEPETRWGKMALSSWGVWRWLVSKVLEKT